MARNLKPQVVKTIKHPRSFETCDLMLDRNRLVFYADYGGAHFQDGAASTVERWINKTLEDSIQITWTPVLHIRSTRSIHEHDEAAHLRVSIKRFWVGVDNGGKVKQSQWIDDHGLEFFNTTLDQYRVRNMQGCRIKFEIVNSAPVLPLKTEDYDRGFGAAGWEQEVYILYDESTWAGLKHLQALIRQLGERLDQLIGNDADRLAITAVGSRLLAALPAPEEKPEPAGDIEPVKRTVTKVHFTIDPDLLNDLGLRIKTDD